MITSRLTRAVLLTSTSIRPDPLSTLSMTLFRLSSSVTFKKVHQKRNEYNPGLVPIPDSREITLSIFS